MSNAFNLEPQAHGLIKLKTTFGDLEVELFTKQCPKNTRKFVQLCLDGYYQGTIFDRVEKDFIAIGGKDQEREGREDHRTASSLFEHDTAPDEFNSRLKFARRGLLATANIEKDSNGPEFFFTLGPAPELQNKHTIFGRLRGNSVYCLVDLNECQVDDDMCPLSEKKIIDVVIEQNPHPELEPRPEFIKKLKSSRSLSPERDEQDKEDDGYLEPKFDVKNSKKLSFYQDSDDDDDDDEEEEEPLSESKKPLQSIPVGDGDSLPGSQDKTTSQCGQEDADRVAHQTPEETSIGIDGGTGPSDSARERRLREVREKIENLKKQLENESATKIQSIPDKRPTSQDSPTKVTLESGNSSSKQSSIDDAGLTSAPQEIIKLAPKKGRQRERETLELLQQFKKKLKETRPTPSSGSSSGGQYREGGAKLHKSSNPGLRPTSYSDDEAQLDDELDLVSGDDWLRHKFDAKSTSDALAKDANTKGDDWYSIDDLRNPMMRRIESDRAREYSSHTKRREIYEEEDEGRHHRDRRSSSKSAGRHRNR